MGVSRSSGAGREADAVANGITLEILRFAQDDSSGEGTVFETKFMQDGR
jgi:hypothetical protein